MSLGVHKDEEGVSLPGKHNRQSALLKSSVLQIRGVSPSAAGDGLCKLKRVNFDVSLIDA